VLRHQLSVLQRTAGRPRLQVGDRFVLAALAQRLTSSACRSLLVRPDTVIGWHRQLVHRKWPRSAAAAAAAGHLSRRHDALGPKDFVECRRELGIPIADQDLG
jgi:hypothetical protein